MQVAGGRSSTGSRPSGNQAAVAAAAAAVAAAAVATLRARRRRSSAVTLPVTSPLLVGPKSLLRLHLLLL